MNFTNSCHIFFLFILFFVCNRPTVRSFESFARSLVHHSCVYVSIARASKTENKRNNCTTNSSDRIRTRTRTWNRSSPPHCAMRTRAHFRLGRSLHTKNCLVCVNWWVSTCWTYFDCIFLCVYWDMILYMTHTHTLQHIKHTTIQPTNEILKCIWLPEMRTLPTNARIK